MATINETDSASMMASIIFNSFEINQSCTITGNVINFDTEEIHSKGELVLTELIRLDNELNVNPISKDGKLKRRSKRLPDTIGGFIAHKIFKFKRETRDEVPVVSIWRIQ